METPQKLFTPTEKIFPADKIPELIFDDEPRFTEFWLTAWQIAWKHVYESPVMPYSPYLGEGCGINRVWIWDSSFMTLFSRYAPDVFPAANTLDNFYRIIADGGESPIAIHHPDNPPLFSWAEKELYAMTGDRERVRTLMADGILQQHYHWLENGAASGNFIPWGNQKIHWQKTPRGYLWSGCPSGMDNTPRGDGDYNTIYWLDALAQQGWNARCIAELLHIAGNEREAAFFTAEYEQKKLLMQSYFDPAKECFLDRKVSPAAGTAFSPVITPASFWPLLAEMATPRQAAAMVKLLTDPEKLGGTISCPSVSRDDPAFHPQGSYWRGGVWLPLCYMTMKAIGRYGWHDLARTLSYQLIDYMKRCYDEYTPHTIWECYSPTLPQPAYNSKGRLVRQDFCGWSALGPIALMLENVVGLEHFCAATRTIRWRLPLTGGRCGIKNLLFGTSRISLTADTATIETDADEAFTLEIDKYRAFCPAGKHRIHLSSALR